MLSAYQFLRYAGYTERAFLFLVDELNHSKKIRMLKYMSSFYVGL